VRAGEDRGSAVRVAVGQGGWGSDCIEGSGRCDNFIWAQKKTISLDDVSAHARVPVRTCAVGGSDAGWRDKPHPLRSALLMHIDLVDMI